VSTGQPDGRLSYPLQQELERHVACCTGRRVRGLQVEVQPGRVVLRGHARSYHVKQLAQHGVRDLLPDVRLENAIVVDGAA
jgi:BON domain